MKTETATLADLKPGNRYIGRDGESEYLILDLGKDVGGNISVANMATGEVGQVSPDHTEIAATQNGRLRVV